MAPSTPPPSLQAERARYKEPQIGAPLFQSHGNDRSFFYLNRHKVKR